MLSRRKLEIYHYLYIVNSWLSELIKRTQISVPIERTHIHNRLVLDLKKGIIPKLHLSLWNKSWLFAAFLSSYYTPSVFLGKENNTVENSYTWKWELPLGPVNCLPEVRIWLGGFLLYIGFRLLLICQKFPFSRIQVLIQYSQPNSWQMQKLAKAVVKKSVLGKKKKSYNMPCFDLVKKQRTPEFFLLFFKLRLRYWSTKINRGRKLVISAHCRYIAF